MPILAATTVLTPPGEFVPVTLPEGTELPEWAIGMVGDHLLDHADGSYETLGYAELAALVKERGLAVESQKKIDLLAALREADASA